MFKSKYTLIGLLAAATFGVTAYSAPVRAVQPVIAATPPMGWNDWAHYQCHYTAGTILANARALVSTGLAAKGYDRVTVDDCWMGRKRNDTGSLVSNSKRFPHGIARVIAKVHRMGLKFGIYEDAGSKTCGGFAGSGAAHPGGSTHFTRDMKLFASWGVDYVKLDGCNVQSSSVESRESVYRRAYAKASAAIKTTGKPMIFLESAPAYFQGRPSWYTVLGWVAQYGQLWREGSDIAIFNRQHPNAPRFRSVMWNYAYNLPLGRYQSPGHWNDPDFIIGGDPGMSEAETRSQIALWSMMSAPLVLSIDVTKLTPVALRILSNSAVIRVDQDPLGKMATLVRRTSARDVLVKTLQDGAYAVAVFDHSFAPIKVALSAGDLGFAGGAQCSMTVQDLWTGKTLHGKRRIDGRVEPGGTAIWRVMPHSDCGARGRTGAIVMSIRGSRAIESYGRCLNDKGFVGPCKGTRHEVWRVLGNGQLQAQDSCLAVVKGAPSMAACTDDPNEHWKYRRNGNLVNAGDNLCLTAHPASNAWIAQHKMRDSPFLALIEPSMQLQMRACGHNAAAQIWALPN